MTSNTMLNRITPMIQKDGFALLDVLSPSTTNEPSNIIYTVGLGQTANAQDLVFFNVDVKDALKLTNRILAHLKTGLTMSEIASFLSIDGHPIYTKSMPIEVAGTFAELGIEFYQNGNSQPDFIFVGLKGQMYPFQTLEGSLKEVPEGQAIQ